MIEPRELNHTDAALQAALVRALEENAMLRRALDERTLAPGARRWVGRTIATLLLVLGAAAGGVYVTQSRNAQAFREGLKEGYNSGWIDGREKRGPDWKPAPIPRRGTAPVSAAPPAATLPAAPPRPPAP